MKRKIIQKLTALALTGILAFSLAACSGSSDTGSGTEPKEDSVIEEEAADDEEPAVDAEVPEALSGEGDTAEAEYSDAEAQPGLLTGGWEKAESPVLTEEMKELTKKASSNLTGAEYTPVAYLASQVVAGINHLLLCRTLPVVPDGVETYTFVTIYEDLEGNAQITDVIDTGLPTNIAQLDGGWNQADSPEITGEIETMCSKGFERLLGVDYRPVALLSTQIVSGTNYCVLCESTVVYPGAETTYSFVYFYENLDGDVEVTDVIACDSNGNIE